MLHSNPSYIQKAQHAVVGKIKEQDTLGVHNENQADVRLEVPIICVASSSVLWFQWIVCDIS